MKKLSEWPKIKKIVAIDFDGTLTIKDNRVWKDSTDNYINDHMEENTSVTDWVRKNRDNMYLILWTSRSGKSLRSAIEFCSSIGIYFDAVNDNIVSFNCSNKIMADIYIDDKSVNIYEITNIRL